jgi:dipeptidyl aminopeptidase/acylaminoacyl peptidase
VRISTIVPDTNLAFAPDGRRFAAAVQQDGGSRLILVDPVADEADWPEVRLPAFAERLAWTVDGLVVLAADPGADAASLTSGRPLTDEEDDPAIARPDAGRRRLWNVEPTTATATPASPPDLAVWEFAPIVGGGTVVIGSDDPSEAGWYHARLIRLDAEGRTSRVLREAGWQLSSPAVSPDGRLLAYVEGWASDRGLLAGNVRLIDLVHPDPPATATTLEAELDVTWLSWTPDGRLWFAGWHHLGTAWGWAEGLFDAGATPAVTVHREAAGCLNSRWHPEVVPLPDGSALTVRSTPRRPPEIVRVGGDGEPAPWTALNPGGADARTMQVSELRWLAPDGLEIEGLIARPADDGTGDARSWPLVVDIHGGPSLAWHHSWDLPWAEVLTGVGYAVLMPNPRGSAGRGQPFAQANLTDPAGAEYADIVAGVAHCVAEGLADPDRVAAMGASYGGYLTAWAVAAGDVFCGGVVIAGMSDLLSCRGTANNAPFYDVLLGGRPSAVAALYLDRSPVTRLGPTSAPALILHGALDRCVPVGQAHELYAGLRDVAVPVDLVVYPREGHQVSEPAHLADQRVRVLDWLAPLLSTPAGAGGHVG